MANKEESERKNKNLIVTFRIFQAIFLGIFALGVSSSFGDISSYMKSPLSIFSITTTIFGLLGSIITGYLARVSENW